MSIFSLLNRYCLKENIKPVQSEKMPLRGEVWTADLNPQAVGDVMNKFRPCVIVSQDNFNTKSNCVTIVPITHSDEFRKTHTTIDNGTLQGVAKAEQMRIISKKQLGKYICHLKPTEMAGVNRSTLYHLFGDDVVETDNEIIIRQNREKVL